MIGANSAASKTSRHGRFSDTRGIASSVFTTAVMETFGKALPNIDVINLSGVRCESMGQPKSIVCVSYHVGLCYKTLVPMNLFGRPLFYTALADA